MQNYNFTPQPMEFDDSTKKLVYAVEVPDALIRFFGSAGGISLEIISLPQLLQMCGKNKIKYLVIDENFVRKHKDVLLSLLKQGRIESLIIHNGHPYAFEDMLINQLNDIAKTQNINMITDGHYDKIYENINVYNIEIWEHVISHFFTLLLSQVLKKKRQHTKTFLMQTVFKDNFRKTIGEFITNSQIYNDFVKSPIIDSATLYKKKDDFLKQIEQKHGMGPHIDALASFGSGLPNFELYEQGFCEIVLESRNQGSWHFTEKTFRPIAMGIPMVYLGHKPMYDRFMEYGYHLYDNNFYQQWHKDIALEEKLFCLGEFLAHIKSSESAQKQMEKTAQHNYQHFWNHRKLHYYANISNTMESLFGRNNLVHNIYKQMNF